MSDIDKEKTCCFFGHRKIDETEELKNKLYEIIENLILNEKIDTFLFGSKSQFDDLCHKVVTELKEKYSHITSAICSLVLTIHYKKISFAWQIFSVIRV